MNIMLDQEILEEKIAEVEYTQVGRKTTICCLTLDSGFEVIGTSCCLNLEDYNEEIGENLAYDNAVRSLLEMEAYHLATNAFEGVAPAVSDDCSCGCCDEQEHDCDCDCEDCEDTCEDSCCDDCEVECRDCDFTECDCFECEESDDCDSCECNDGCPNVSCPQNEEFDFQGYEDDGTEDYPEDAEESKCDGNCLNCKTLHNDKEDTKEEIHPDEPALVLALHILNPALSFDEAVAKAKRMLK